MQLNLAALTFIIFLSIIIIVLIYRQENSSSSSTIIVPIPGPAPVTPQFPASVPPPPTITTIPSGIFPPNPPFMYTNVGGIGNAWTLFDRNYNLDNALPSKDLESITIEGLGYTDSLDFFGFNLLREISFPHLVRIGNIFFEDFVATNIEIMNFSSLEDIYEELYFFEINFDNIPLTFPALKTIGYDGIYFQGFGGDTSIEFPLLRQISGRLYISDVESTSMDFSSLEEVSILNDEITISNCSNLTDLSFPSLLKTNCTYIDFTGNALSEASVDSILASLVALDGTNGTQLWEDSQLEIGGGTNSAPSAAGLASIAILQGRANVINTN